MLTQTAEYALRAAVSLARTDDRPVSAESLAGWTCIPRRYLHHVLQALVKHKLVRSFPGPGGGYQLARSPDEITVLDIVNAVSPLPRIRQCPLGVERHGTNICRLHRVLDHAAKLVEDAFRSVRLSELLPERAAVPPLCSPLSLEKPQKLFRKEVPHASNASTSAGTSRH